jgi:hypothetical protein
MLQMQLCAFVVGRLRTWHQRCSPSSARPSWTCQRALWRHCPSNHRPCHLARQCHRSSAQNQVTCETMPCAACHIRMQMMSDGSGTVCCSLQHLHTSKFIRCRCYKHVFPRRRGVPGLASHPVRQWCLRRKCLRGLQHLPAGLHERRWQAMPESRHAVFRLALVRALLFNHISSPDAHHCFLMCRPAIC